MKLLFKYRAKPIYILVYFILLLASIYLISGRSNIEWQNKLVLFLSPDFYSHVTNFSISLEFVIIVGFCMLMSGAKYRAIILLGIGMAIANIICETLMGFLNTLDIIDALYGIYGTTISCAYLYALSKSGLKPRVKKKAKA